MSTKQNGEKSIFKAALELKTAAERTAYVEKVCADDPALRPRIFALLKAHEDKGDFLEALLDEPVVLLDNLELKEKPGTVIGRYKLLERIGEGGMAVVYMAEQEKPIRRKVALKIIKLGMDTKSVIARFEAERQALAIMNHPNIAKVLDAGATETGRPYFVMDLVPGICITEYCDNNRLSIEERLSLFISVCSAVQHAHQKGIIHRDIKPSNIMVTLHDGKPVPKVIDFGIAKATNQRLTEKTLFTRYAHIIGTPAYMSPEQAELSDLDVDTRTDIYSLGVLLYELLTGTTPFSEDELREAAFLQMHKIICEEEPTKPSTKLSTLGEALTDVAKGHNSSPESLPKLVRGDLDWIVMKSLEKERAHRYDTVSALALDVQRHLDNEPVLARAPKVIYRFQKFLRRHQYQTIAVLAIAVLIGTVIIIFSMWNRNRLQLADAEFFTHSGILDRARTSFSERDFPAALKDVKSILDSKHVGPEARLFYAGILVEGSQTTEAISILESLIIEEREIAGAAHALLARVYWEGQFDEDKKLQEVNEHRQKAEALLLETAESYFLRALTTPSIKEKLNFLHQALDLDPSHYESLKLRVYINYASKKYEEAEADARVMVALKVQDNAGYKLQGLSLQGLGRYREAVSNFDKAIAGTEEDNPEFVELLSQRRQTYMLMAEYEKALSDAQRCVALSKGERIHQFHLFCALLGSGRYDLAETIYREVFLPYRTLFWQYCAGFVHDMLGRGQDLHLPKHAVRNAAFLPLVEAAEGYRATAAKGRRVIDEGFHANWSPDGTKLIYSLGLHGTSGIATYDISSQETELLILPGRDAAYSPDGRFIAYVRDRDVLRISNLTKEREPIWDQYLRFEVWLMRSDGTDARPLTSAKSFQWCSDSQHLLCWNLSKNRTLRYISIGGEAAQSDLVEIPAGCHPDMSPNGNYRMIIDYNRLSVIDESSQEIVGEWTCPIKFSWTKNWSPDSDKLALVSREPFLEPEIGRSLWIYDMGKNRCTEVMGFPIFRVGWVSWSPDSSRLAVAFGRFLHDIWIIDVESLGSGRTLKEHYLAMVGHYTRMIEADPKNAKNFYGRAQYFDRLNESESARLDMKACAQILIPFIETSSLERRFSSIGRIEPLDFRFGPAVNLGPNVNTDSSEGPFCLSSDELELYFASDRPDGFGGWDIWYSNRTTISDNWSLPINIGSPLNTSYEEAPYASSPNGLELYISSNRPGGIGSDDIWISRRLSREDEWGAPENLGDVVNSSSYDYGASLSADGCELYFNSTRPSRLGSSDTYVCRRLSLSDEWDVATNLGPWINSPKSEMGGCISPDGKRLFISEHHSNQFRFRKGGFGKGDIWVSIRSGHNDLWSVPVNLGPQINSSYYDGHPKISSDGSKLYFCSNRPDGYGKHDIWEITILSSESKGIDIDSSH